MDLFNYNRLSEKMFIKLHELEKLYVHCDCTKVPAKLIYYNSKLKILLSLYLN